MSFFSSWFSRATATEAEILTIAMKIRADIAIAEADVNKALNWVNSNIPTIVRDINAVTSIVISLGLAGQPNVAAAVAAANVAVATLNAFAAARAAGGNNTDAVVAGMHAVNQAAGARAAAVAALLRANVGTSASQ